MTISNDLTNDEMVLVYNALVAERKEYKQLASNFFHSDRMGAFYGHRKIVEQLDAIIEKVKGMIDWGEQDDDYGW